MASNVFGMFAACILFLVVHGSTSGKAKAATEWILGVHGSTSGKVKSATEWKDGLQGVDIPGDVVNVRERYEQIKSSFRHNLGIFTFVLPRPERFGHEHKIYASGLQFIESRWTSACCSFWNVNIVMASGLRIFCHPRGSNRHFLGCSIIGRLVST